METMKKIANGFGIILSSLLSIVLIFLLFCTPVVSAVCSFTQTDTLQKVIKDIDFVELVSRHEELRVTLEKYGIDGHFLDGITETELVEQLVDAYVKSIFEGKAFDPHIAEDIIRAHKDEAVSLFRRLAEEKGNDTAGITDEEFFTSILDAVHSQWEEIVASLPSAEDMGLTQEDYDEWAAVHGDGAQTLNAPLKLTQSEALPDEQAEEIPVGKILFYIRSGGPVKVMAVLISVVSLLIFLFRWPCFQGFVWLAVVYFLAAVLLFSGTGALSSQPAQQMIPTEGVMDLLIMPVISVFTAEMNLHGVIWAVLGLVFVVAYVLGRLLLQTFKKSSHEQAQLTPASEAAEQSIEPSVEGEKSLEE